MEYAKKLKTEALQIVGGFRKSYRMAGVADSMKIHAEARNVRGRVRFLVSWIPAPFFDSVNKNVSEQRALLDRFKSEAGLPASYEVSFGSARHIAGIATAHIEATQRDGRQIDPFNDMFVRTDRDEKGVRFELCWHDKSLQYNNSGDDELRHSNIAVCSVGVIKALPMAELIPEGYKIEEDVLVSKFEMKDLEYLHFLEKDQNPILGKDMRPRALALNANLGYLDAKRMMVRSAEIPNEYRKKSILFPGTRLLSSSGVRVIPRMYRQDDGSWRLSSLGINNFWQHDDILVRLKQNEETTKGETP